MTFSGFFLTAYEFVHFLYTTAEERCDRNRSPVWLTFRDVFISLGKTNSGFIGTVEVNQTRAVPQEIE